MTSRLLFLNNYRDQKVPEKLDRFFETLGFSVETRHAWAGEVPASVTSYDAVFLSGSEISPWEEFDWIEGVCDLVHQVAARAVPTLGICFGSQILAYALCGKESVFRRADYEIGLVDLLPENDLGKDPIGYGIEGRFPIFSWHRDEIISKHPDIQILATSDVCGNHIWRYRDLPLWGIQSHPEAGSGTSFEWLQHHKEMLFFAGLDFEASPYDSGFSTPTAMRLIENFAHYVIGQQKKAC